MEPLGRCCWRAQSRASRAHGPLLRACRWPSLTALPARTHLHPHPPRNPHPPIHPGDRAQAARRRHRCNYCAVHPGRRHDSPVPRRSVRQLRHRFGPILTHFSALPRTRRVTCSCAKVVRVGSTCPAMSSQRSSNGLTHCVSGPGLLHAWMLIGACTCTL